MDRIIELGAIEQIRADQLQSEHRELLARYGAATLEIETVRALLPQVKERQRQLVDEITAREGIAQYASARIEGGRLICRLPAAAEANGRTAEAAP